MFSRHFTRRRTKRSLITENIMLDGWVDCWRVAGLNAGFGNSTLLEPTPSDDPNTSHPGSKVGWTSFGPWAGMSQSELERSRNKNLCVALVAWFPVGLYTYHDVFYRPNLRIIFRNPVLDSQESSSEKIRKWRVCKTIHESDDTSLSEFIEIRWIAE